MAAVSPLSNGFPPRSEATWRAMLAATTGGKALASLVARSDDGIAVGPLYQNASEAASFTGRSPGPWTVVPRIDAPEQILPELLADFAGNPGGVALTFQGCAAAHGRGLAPDADLGRLLAGIPIEDLAVRIDAGEATHRLVDAVIGLAAERGIAPARLSLTAAFDPIATLAGQGWLERPSAALDAEIVATARQFSARGIKGAAAVADGRPWHDGGASEAEELAAVLAGLVAYLRLFEAAGLDLGEAAGRIATVLAADADQFLTIAKFRAFRQLHGRLLEAAGIPSFPAMLHAETSWRMMSRRDPHGNILRATIAGFASGVGGADSVTVLPFDLLGPRQSFAHRLARNTELILLAEGNVARVADPGAGSGAIETLTADLAAAAWGRFQAIEAAGGLLAVVRAGGLQRDIAATQAARAARIATRRSLLTGVSAFPDPDGVARPLPAAAAPEPVAVAETAARLTRARLAEPFEGLRDRADGLTAAGKRPSLFLANLGRPTAFAAGANFATSLFAIAGIAATENRGFADTAAALAAFTASGAALACISGVTEADAAGTLAAALKAHGARRVYCVAKQASAAEVEAAGIDRVLYDGVDTVAVLRDGLDAVSGEVGRLIM